MPGAIETLELERPKLEVSFEKVTHPSRFIIEFVMGTLENGSRKCLEYKSPNQVFFNAFIHCSTSYLNPRGHFWQRYHLMICTERHNV